MLQHMQLLHVPSLQEQPLHDGSKALLPSRYV
jgi:hypothetical protein